ncbi:class I adenylate-forming enzyme family protein [Simplicispira psychrophila]|uniref:class I adenylate-forming enzyme family protein n=1 Tax=Simplicispira psychrophila TaxID=80882 RepID=UPI00068E6D23|nr:class I adenylate-forming enzyme family protein [Simplicispira psychrophila]
MNANVNSSATRQDDFDLLALAERCRAQLTAPGAPFELVSVGLNGQQLPAYRNAFTSLPALLNAGRVHGASEFMVYEGERWTFARFYQAADALAGRLQAEHGVQAGDRVAIAMRNRPEWVVAFVAVALIGAVPAPLNSFGLREELLSGLRDVQPRWLICDAERFVHVGADLAALGCRAAVVDGAPGQGDVAWAALLAPGAPALQPPTLALDDEALILFTSGASSQAKGVLSTQRAVCQALYNIDYIGAIAAMTSPDLIATMLARKLQPTTLTAVPLFHVSGLHAQLLASLRHGRRLVFMRRWSPTQALELIQKEKITQFNGAPSMVMQLLAEPGFDDPTITASLGGVGFGGAGLPQRVIDDVLERRRDAMSGVGFGLTESNGVGAAAAGQLFQAHPQSAGQVSPIIELRIAEFDGTPVPDGESGEIWLRGVSLMQGYCAQPDATARALADGWFRTGDIGLLEPGGFVRVVDRIKDVINRAGEKIAAAEIESCLLQHPDLVEAAVFAQSDDQTGEAVIAVVVLAPGARVSAQEVQAHVAARLAAYKVPKQVHVRQEELPRNPAGKLLKTLIKREYVAI